MSSPLPLWIRARGRLPLVVVVVLVALCSLGTLVRPAGAVGAPTNPVPVGVWPLQPAPEVVRAFEPPSSLWGAGHRGVDLAGSVGQVVHTALAGRVTFASRLAGRDVVVVDHGTTRTTYEPVTATVRVGDVLARGQPIGALAVAGSHCFPRACLHWGWRRGDAYLDPLLLVGGGPIVLLPLWADAPASAPSSRRLPASPYADLVAGLLARSAPTRPVSAAPTPRPVTFRPTWHRPLAMRPLLL